MGVSFSPRYSTAYLDDMAFPPNQGIGGGEGGRGEGGFSSHREIRRKGIPYYH